MISNFLKYFDFWISVQVFLMWLKVKPNIDNPMKEIPDFAEVKKNCDMQSALTEDLISEYLMYYAAGKNNLDKQMREEFNRYKHIADQLPKSIVNLFKSQYIIHSVFREKGSIHKLLKQSGIRHFNSREKKFLDFNAAHPWKSSFCRIIDHPAPDFYEMMDEFRHESFLLYSPGITRAIAERSVSLWFILRSFNGSCWQTMGVLSGYQSFTADDIYFFATELNPAITNDEELIDDVETNPVPYMMLLIGAQIPVLMTRDFLSQMNFSEFNYESFNTDDLRKDFKIEYSEGVYRLQLNGSDEKLHFAAAYFDEKRKVLLLSAYSQADYLALVKKLNEHGCSFDEMADMAVQMTMLLITEDILKTRFLVNIYNDLFEIEPTVEEQIGTDKMNKILAELIPHINEGKLPDVDELAVKYEVNPDDIIRLLESFMHKLE